MANGRTSIRERIRDMTNDPAMHVMADAMDDFRDEVLQGLARNTWTTRFVLGALVTLMGVIVAVAR